MQKDYTQPLDSDPSRNLKSTFFTTRLRFDVRRGPVRGVRSKKGSGLRAD